MVYWSDSEESTIYRAGVASGQKEVFLNASFGIGAVHGESAQFPLHCFISLCGCI